jgi:hypothetical protein
VYDNQADRKLIRDARNLEADRQCRDCMEERNKADREPYKSAGPVDPLVRPSPTWTKPRRVCHTPACSNGLTDHGGHRVIESQSVRLTAKFLRPERRSDDGQAILDPLPAA